MLFLIQWVNIINIWSFYVNCNFIYYIPFMKIAFVTDNDRYSGIWRQNYALYDWLKKQWLNVDLINLYIPSRFKWTPEWKQIKSNIFSNYYLSLFYGAIYVFPNKLKRILKEWGYTHVILGHQFMAYLYSAHAFMLLLKFYMHFSPFLSSPLSKVARLG